MDTAKQIDDLLAMLDSHDLNDRVAAIQILGEIGDENALRMLRERLALANKETAALIVAVGKLNKNLGVK
jgi:HEAT repeat protein